MTLLQRRGSSARQARSAISGLGLGLPLYTREAHPGEHLGAHATFEEKLAAARRLRDELDITRPILVDDWEGTVHTAYGLLPNMCWVLDRGGVIRYKAMWTSAEPVEAFLNRQDGASRGNPVQAPFHTEQLELRRHDRSWFKQALERNGPRSVTEFARAEEIWAERARARRAD